MQKIDTIQTSFVGGEFGPSLNGRTDIDQYKQACAIIVNWLIRPFGSIISTPGLQFINQALTGGSTTLTGARIIPFQFSVTDSYIIEVGAGNFRFYTNGAVVVSTGTTPYTLTNSYAAPSISTIQYCQNHDVVYLTQGQYTINTLTRNASANWALAAFAFTGGPFMPGNLTLTTLQSSASASGASTTLSASGNIFTVSSATTTGHNGTWWSIGSTITSATTGLAIQGCVQITTVTNPSTAAATVYQTLTTTAATTTWAEGSWSAVRGYPSCCCFYQGRLFFARTSSEPQTVWGSATFNFTNYAVNGGADDDALNLQLSATQGNDIKWLVPMNDLIVGTYGGEFCITAGIGTGNAITPSNVGVIQQTSWGSEPIIPKKIGNFAYYIQRGQQKLREITFQFLQSLYQSTDRTILSPQVAGGGFIDIGYQQNPDTVLWCLCSNGTLATMTREIDQKVQAWSRQVTSGSFSSIAIIPSQSGPYDEVWVMVLRTINGSQVNYIERYQSQLLPTQGNSTAIQQDQLFYVHSGLTYSAFTATSSTSISLSATAGTIVVTSSAAYFSASQVGNRLRAVDAYDNMLGEITITGYTSSTIIVGTSTSNFSATSYSAQSWGISVTKISGITWLEAQTVVVNADGGVDYPSKVVSNGAITLGSNYYVVTVGLQATQTILTLPQETPDPEGTAQGKKQRINNISFKLNNSYTGFLLSGTTGTQFIAQARLPSTIMGTPPPLYTGILPNITFQDDYRYGSQVLIQNTDPFPVEILSLTTTISTFDK